MKKMMLAIALLLVLVSCGGGGDESCTYDISLATNGATQETATSYWDCLSSHGDEGAFSLFDNGAGLEVISSQIIAVTWEETGCREAHVVDAAGGAQLGPCRPGEWDYRLPGAGRVLLDAISHPGR